MSNFTSPLNNIRVASPCPANWDDMFGDERKRFCGSCKLNVYNLSGMTRREAENLLIDSEGRLCVRYFRRSDGTVLTKDCPVGWQAVKRRVSRVATAVFSSILGLFGGIFAFNLISYRMTPTMGSIAEPLPADPGFPNSTLPKIGEMPGISKIDPLEVKGEIDPGSITVGRVETGKIYVLPDNKKVKGDKLKKRINSPNTAGGVIEMGDIQPNIVISKN